MNIKPLGDKVVIKPLKVEEKTQSGIVLPGSAQEKPHQGEVIAVGSGVLNDKGERVALEVKPGDKVVYGKFGGTEVKLDDEEVVIIAEKDILVVLG
ncbi:MAG: co-chaperone GroES [Clostridiales bacterium]|uniref:Co-chaperonin GroES n=1 Tax=Peptococcus niger TaxID=2741 RepID=A0A1G6YPA0_PEPNI|nr:co-chaperone GroES [Peptococcus niger]MBS5594738.1 co-chaperone GroES [Clostridiales bacterium]MDU7505517.1 co-chaperone GroES [Clostridia bacterium]MBS5916180.1 co-chaperone GroES [Clostridiales bacterium]MDU1028256.1 co-chaperone GroES [Clostridiales bacterium]MDU2292789.1 co-chaperone GroES [Peptococcus niger]